MKNQIFIPFKNCELCATIFNEPSNDKNVVILPPLCDRTMAGIRYFTSILAKSLFEQGNNVITFDYPGTGDSGGEMKDATLEELINAGDVVYDFFENYTKKSVNTIIGVAMGNYIAAILSNKKSTPNLILLNPDYEAIKAINNDKSLLMPRTTLNSVQGYFETPYALLTENGSEPSHEILDFENPTIEQRFWDTLVGPLYGGESEAVSCRVIENIGELDYYQEIINYTGSLTILYWGKCFIESNFAVAIKNKSTQIDCGKLTNKEYWLEASYLFDNIIGQVCYVVKEFKNDSEDIDCVDCYDINQLKCVCKDNSVFIKAHSFEVEGEWVSGVLSGAMSSKVRRNTLVIFEHGLGCDRVAEFRAWYMTSKELSQNGFWCYRYDHRGSGMSDGLFEDSLYSKYVEDCKEAISSIEESEKVKFDNILIVSWSSGARISWLIAKKVERLTGLVMWSPVISEVDATSRVKLFRNSRRKFVFPISPLWLSKEFLLYEKDENLIELYDQCNLPALVITGELDDEECYRYVAERAKGRECDKYVMIKGSGHCYSQNTINDVIKATVEWVKDRY